MEVQEFIGRMTGGLAQQDRLLKFDTPLAANTLLPQRVVGRSRIGRNFDFTVDLVSTSDGIELKSLIAQPVTLWIQQADRSYAAHHGYVNTARRLGSNGSTTSYQLAFSSWMHFLRFRKDARIWQDRPADEILTDVFNQHPQAQGAFRFALKNPLPSRSFCVQYEDDWNFCHRIMESEGLFFWFEQADNGKAHTLVVTDDLTSLPPLARLGGQPVEFYRAGTGSETNALVQWSGTRTLHSTSLATRTFDYMSPSAAHPRSTSIPTLATHGDLPPQAEVYEYTGAYSWKEQARGDRLSTIRMEEWESRAKRFHGSGAVRGMDAGGWFRLANHPVHDQGDASSREFAVIETTWFIENNLPVSTDAPGFPHSLKSQIDEIRQANVSTGAADGQVTRSNVQRAMTAARNVFSVPHADGSEGFFLVQLEAQRLSVPFRSPFEHAKPTMHLQTGTVAGPANEEVYTDALNRIKVRMHWDRLNQGDERASCWMRVAQSDTGGGYGAVHVPRIGEEVVVDWVGGDCDRPIVTGRVYNGANAPQWHSNGLLSGFRSKEYGGSGFNHLVMDDSTGQNRVHLYSSTTGAHLHLGYLIAQTGNTRGNYLGSGFDLKSDAYGAVRAARGLMLTTQPAAREPLDAASASQQLASAESVLDSLSTESETHQAASLNDGRGALKAFNDATRSSVDGAHLSLEPDAGAEGSGGAASTGSGGRTAGGGTGKANTFKEPVMLLTSPAGIALSTQKSVHFGADEQLNIVSGQNTHVAAGKSLIASVAQSLSLFVQNAGMKLFAAKGKVEVRAHSDNIELTAQKTLKLLSATQNIEAAAKQEVLLTSGGAYIRISGGNIEIHAPGMIDIKGSQHAFNGPASQPYDLPALPAGEMHNKLELNLADDSLKPIPNAPYKVMFENGGVMSGKLDANGYAVLHDVPPGPVKAFFGEDARPFTQAPLPAAKDLAPDDVLKELHAAGHGEITQDNLASLFNRFSGRPDVQ